MPSKGPARRAAPTQTAYRADCVAALKKPRHPYKLTIADPPYNFAQEYDAYHDRKSYDAYLAWTKAWLAAAVAATDRHGALWVFAPDEWVAEVDVHCRHALRLTRRNWIIWAFTFGQKAQRRFTRSHCHILYYSLTKSVFTFNEGALLVPSARQLVYKDRRAVAAGKPPDDTWMLLKEQLEPHMTPDRDTWLASRICGTYKERRKHSPNQIPLPVMERIVLACSDPGDWVLDPFAGSGSSGVACALHGRNWDGYDVSDACVKASNERITRAREEAHAAG